MSDGDLLSIHPFELKFPFELRKQSSCSFQLINKTDKYVAFKVKTSNPKNYSVRPKTGVVSPRSACNVTVTMQAPKEEPSDMQCKDKFLLQSVIAADGATTKDITSEMFIKDGCKAVEEFKLRVVYIPADCEEGSSPRASTLENRNQNAALFNAIVDATNPKIDLGVMSSGDLLSIHPSELQFPFELRKHSSCSFQLINKTYKYVAFKVKTSNPKNYYVRSNPGVVSPRSACNVTVTMQAPKEEPSDMQCKDKFLLQSVIAAEGATTKDITSEMFIKDGRKAVEEFKLRVVYIPANLPSPVPEGCEEGSSLRASTLENGNQNAALFDAPKCDKKKSSWYFFTIIIEGVQVAKSQYLKVRRSPEEPKHKSSEESASFQDWCSRPASGLRRRPGRRA